MNAINIFLLMLSVATFSLSAFIFLRNRKNAVNLSFSTLVAIAGLWPLSIALFREAHTITLALFWDRIIYICAILISPAILAFAHIFTEGKFKLKVWRLFAYIAPLIILISLLLLTNLWIEDVVLNPWGNSAMLGPAYLLWVIWFMAYMIWGFVVLFNKYRRSAGLIKMQLRYILLSLAFPALGSVPFNVIAPLFGYYRLIWIGPIFLVAMMGIITYAILRYRLMDIRLL